MAIQFPDLPYDYDTLEPYISVDTLKTHHLKHHKAYVEKLNKLIHGTDYDNLELEQIVLRSSGNPSDQKIYNNAAQAWNHQFYWDCMTEPAKRKKNLQIGKMIEDSFGSFSQFEDELTAKVMDLFGSGWVWLVKEEGDRVGIVSLGNAGNPMVQGKVPLLVCDVWEHAYYLDYKNEREKYFKGFLHLINWDFAESNLEHKVDQTIAAMGAAQKTQSTGILTQQPMH